MPSSYSDQLRLELQANGENASTWGTKTNTNLELLESSISGLASVATTGGATTLSTGNGSDDESRHAMLKFTGTLVSNATITVPTKTKQYMVWNATSGAYTLQVKTSGGTGIYVPQGTAMFLFCDGTNVLASGGVVTDANFRVVDNSDNTKQLAFEVSGLTTGTTRTITWPDATMTIQATTGYTYNFDMLTQLPQQSKSADYTLVLGDAGKHILHPSTDANNRVFTIPANSSVAYPIGTVLMFINMANTVTLACADTLYLAGTGATGSKTLVAYGTAMATKIGTTSWVISGTGVA